MLGGFSVGKTSLVKRFAERVFSETYPDPAEVKTDKNRGPEWNVGGYYEKWRGG